MKIELATLQNQFSRPPALAQIDPKFNTIHSTINQKHRKAILKMSIFANTALSTRYFIEKSRALYIMIELLLIIC